MPRGLYIITIKDNVCDLLCNCNCIFWFKRKQKTENKSYIPNLTSFFAVFVSVWLVTLVSCSALFLFFVEKKKEEKKEKKARCLDLVTFQLELKMYHRMTFYFISQAPPMLHPEVTSH